MDSFQQSGKKIILNLRQEFLQKLPAKIEELDAQLVQFIDSSDNSDLIELQYKLHRLAGSAGIFGVVEIGDVAKKAEILIVSHRKNPDIESMISGLKESILQFKQFDINNSLSNYEPRIANNFKVWNNLIYLVGTDITFLGTIKNVLERSGYQIALYDDPNKIKKTSDNPAVILIDMDSGYDHIYFPQTQQTYFPLPIFLSDKKDMESKLAAARDGFIRYFKKPLDYKKLASTIDKLTLKNVHEPFRVLIIDDDVELLKYLETVLQETGIDTVGITDPYKTLEVIDSFKPELILLDVQMPGCSGLELAAVIRQDDKYAKISIVFLTVETGLDKKMTALRLGGDDYLTKPIDMNPLREIIINRLQRTRLANQLNQELEASLRESKFQQITLNKHAIVTIADERGHISFVNEKFSEISGFSLGELIGKDYKVINSGLHPSSFFKQLWTEITQGRVWRGVLRNKKKNGDYFWVDTSIVPFLNDNGVPYKYVCVSTDISKFIQSQASLQKTEKQLRAIFENMQDVFFRIDEDGIIAMISPSVKKYFGVESEQLRGKSLAELTGNTVLETLFDTLDDSRGVVNDFEFQFEDRYMAITCHKRVYEEDQTGIEGVIRDISERKALEHSLQEEKVRAEEANMAKSHFLLSMSHELRTPLNAILGFSQLIEMDEMDGEHRNSISEIIFAGKHLLGLIDEVLDLAKIEAGRIELNIQQVNVRDVIDECCRYVDKLVKENNIEIVINDNSSLRRVNTDVKRLRQIIINLISNAVKYNKKYGRVSIEYIIEGDWLRIDVSDTGVGISEKDAERVFTPFERLDKRGKVEGTGIGLVITKNLVNKIGGRMGFKSKLGQGSHFWVEIPSDLAGGTKAINRRDEYKSKKVSNGSSSWKVLYVEDNYANLRLIEKLLSRKENVKLHSAVNSQQAFELIEKYSFDLILLDINLPDLSGYEIYDILRNKYKIDDTPIIAISANAMQKDVEKGESVFDAYITKPIDVRRFVNLIETILE